MLPARLQRAAWPYLKWAAPNLNAHAYKITFRVAVGALCALILQLNGTTVRFEPLPSVGCV
jgi:hypothetical protein